MLSLDPIFDWIVAATLRASIMVLVILVVQRLLSSRLSPKWKYALWIPVLVTILIPALPLLPHWARLTADASPVSPQIESVSGAVTVNDVEFDRQLISVGTNPTAGSVDEIVANETDVETVMQAKSEMSELTDTEHGLALSAVAETEQASRSVALWQQSWDWRAMLTGVWQVGVVCFNVAVSISFALMLHRIRRSAIPMDQSDLARVESLAKELGLRTTPQVWLSPEVKTPSVCGAFRPMLLLNENFFRLLTREEGDFVLRHELIHIRRGDVWLNSLLFVLLTLHWFNPLLWFAFFRVRADREAACDDDVLREVEPARRVAYGKTLLKLDTSFTQPGLCLGLVGILQGKNRLRDRIYFISNPRNMGPFMKTLLSLSMMLVSVLGIAEAAQPQQKSTESVPKSEQTDDRKPWQSDLSECFDHLQDIAKEAKVPDRQYLAEGILRGTDSWAIPVLHPYADKGKIQFFNGFAELKPKQGTVQWSVNEALKAKPVNWEFEVAQSKIMNAGDKQILELVPRYDDGGDQFSLKIPSTRLSTIRVPVADLDPDALRLIAGDRIRVEGTIGDFASNEGVQLTTFTGPIVVYKRTQDNTLLQTTISIGLQDAKLTTKTVNPFRFRKVLSVPTTNHDDFQYARVAVSIDQKAVISRNYLISRGQDVRDRIGAYLWRLDQEKPQRTELPDSTTFGFVPHSNLAYQVHWGRGVQFWDTDNHSVSGDYLPHELREDTTLGPAVSPNGKVMVTRSELNHLQFWDIKTRKPITKGIKQAGIVYGIDFSPDDKWLFATTHKYLTIWESDTGKLSAGPLRHDIHGHPYSTANDQLVTFENNDEHQDVWNSKLVIRSVDGFAETRSIDLEGHVREAHWVDEAHVLVVADNKKPGDEGPYSYGRKLIYLVSLADEAKVTTLMRRNWISNVHVAPSGGYFIVRTREETSCWKVGQAKPVWTKPGNRLAYFGDGEWVLLHSGAAIAHSLDDGRELWRKDGVRICRTVGSSIWTCIDNKMEVWQVESDAEPKKNDPNSAPAKFKSDTRSEPDVVSFQLLKDKDGRVRTAFHPGQPAIRRLIESGKAKQEDFVPLARLQQLPHLQRLSISYGSKLTINDLKSFSKLGRIVEIEMGFAGIDSEYVTIEGSMQPLGQMKSLEVLRFCKDGVHDDDLPFVGKLPQLHTLEFRADNGREDAPVCTDKCAEYVCQARQLRHVIIHGGQFTDQFVAALVRGLPKLETLQLNSAKFTDESLRSIAQHGKNLRELSIASNQFTADGVRSLDSLSNLTVVSVKSSALR